LPKGVKFGFNKEKAGTYYLDKDKGRLRGWQEIDGDKYYFSMAQTGYMRTGKATIEGKEYEFTKDGKLIEKTKKINSDNKTESKNSTTELKDNKKDNKKDKKIETKRLVEKTANKEESKNLFISTDKGRYYLDEEGEVVEGWYEIDESIYYFSPSNDGFMEIGKVEIDEIEYEFDEDGKLLDDPKNLLINTDKGRYYLDEEGEVVEGWYEIDESIYYFSPSDDGLMKTGEVEIDEEEYEFGEDGKIVDEDNNLAINKVEERYNVD